MAPASGTPPRPTEQTETSPDGAERLSRTVERVVANLPDSDEARTVREAREAARIAQAVREWFGDFCHTIGQRHSGCTFGNYKIEHPGQQEVVSALRAYDDDMEAEVAEGNGVVLFGPSGTGKDHLLAALAKNAIRRHGIQVVWANGIDLYGELRDRIRNDQAEAEWVAKMTKPAILYVSDPIPSKGNLSDYQVVMLQRILDKRNRFVKPTWVSMNVRSSQEADDRMGAALVDRLRPGSIGAFCRWPSHREIRMVWPLTGPDRRKETT